MDEPTILALLVARAKQLGVDPSTDAMAYQRLGEAAKKAAIELRSMRTTEVNLPYIGATAEGPVHLLVALPDAGASSGPRIDPRVKLS
jgi:molecular chaperone DnaK